MNRSTAIEIAKILKALISIAEISIINNTFINAFIHKSILKADGLYYLHGSFNLNGTISGRLSSSGPNLQNIPSTGSKYAKDIKKCFIAPPGYLLVGADYNSLEDKISALTTKDKNKLKVYTDGYCGHCLRAYSYFSNEMPDIINTINSINSIKNKYPKIRQKSKTPTFLLTYGGTYIGIIDQCGLSEKEAKSIEVSYHALYIESDKWVKQKLIQASKDGYVTCAFGLKVRTPILKQTVLGNKSTPYEAQAESRTAGNALGQSYGLLNNRSSNAFMTDVYNSKYKYDIKPIAQVHDSSYCLVKNTIGTVKFVNDNLVKAMQWQDLPEIQHPTVKLGGELEIYYPHWGNAITLPNKALKSEILALCNKKNK